MTGCAAVGVSSVKIIRVFWILLVIALATCSKACPTSSTHLQCKPNMVRKCAVMCDFMAAW